VTDDFPRSTAQTRRLAFLFGALYFVQGVAEPTAGLISQPVRSLLRAWGHDAAAIGAFVAVLSIPWMIKPLYGLLTDFVPLFGTRRKSWLILWTAATSLALTALWLVPPGDGARTTLLVMLFVPTVGIAFTDVVVDGLMVEEGQPRGITGTLQSVQWACIYGAGIGTGWLGGYLSARSLQTLGFAICAVTALGSLVLAVTMVREPPTARPEGTLRGALEELLAAALHPSVLGVGVFLFLVNFNPFGSTVQYMHITEHLGLGEELYGKMASVQAAAAVGGAAAYGWINERVSFRVLVHGCIVGAIACTLCWWGVVGATSALVIALLYGFVFMLVTLVQLDMAARYCPPSVAATVFALLMSLSNLSVSLSEAVGGSMYTAWIASMGEPRAYAVLVAVGAGFTALCWFVVPWLNRLAAREATAESG
jgi:Na+/melibiose symporter-like transporter